MRPFITSIIRHWLSVISGSLLTLGIINYEESKAFVEAAAPLAVGLVFYIGPQLWSFVNIKLLQKLGDRFKL